LSYASPETLETSRTISLNCCRATAWRLGGTKGALSAEQALYRTVSELVKEKGNPLPRKGKHAACPPGSSYASAPRIAVSPMEPFLEESELNDIGSTQYAS